MKQRKENVSRILEDEGKCMADKTKVFSKRDKNVDYMNQIMGLAPKASAPMTVLHSLRGMYRLTIYIRVMRYI